MFERFRWRGLYQFPLALLWTSVYYPPLIVFTLLTLGRLNPALVYRFCRVYGRVMLALLSIRLEVEGRERMTERAPRIMLFNHTSLLDLFVVCALFPPGGVAIVKKEIARLPLIGLLWWVLGMIFIDRGDGARARASMARTAKRIRDRAETVILAPEGTRSADGELRPFKKGAFHLALETGAPIMPLVILDAHRANPKGSLTVTPGVIRAHFLEAISTRGWRRETLEEHVAQVRDVYLSELAAAEGRTPDEVAEPLVRRTSPAR